MTPVGDLWKKWCETTKTSFKGEVLFNEPLSKHTYYKIGGPAAILAFPEGLSDLEFIRNFSQNARKEGTLPIFFFGLGSNLLVSDQGFPGICLKLSKLNSGLELTSKNEVNVGSSVSVNSFLRFASKEGLGGLEFLAGIPGNIGGAVAMNAGTHLGDCSLAVTSFRSYSFLRPESEAIKNYAVTSSDFSYRQNHLWSESEIILDVSWKVHQESPEKVKALIDETLRRRKLTQPLEFPSCGSVFRNPIGTSLKAWEVIEKLGLRGYKIGGAQISEKHPNWIVNQGGASANDVWGLIEKCKHDALSLLGIHLEPEVKWVGNH
jgi:UDP-N-acetylmuramate dehydrogenase